VFLGVVGGVGFVFGVWGGGGFGGLFGWGGTGGGGGKRSRRLCGVAPKLRRMQLLKGGGGNVLRGEKGGGYLG